MLKEVWPLFLEKQYPPEYQQQKLFRGYLETAQFDRRISRVIIIRHGDPDRRLSKPDFLANAYDLSPKGIANVNTTTLRLIKLIDNSPITILTSPLPRTLHTSRLISEQLKKTGCKVKHINSTPVLGEVSNFDYNLLGLLVNGGVWRSEGSEYEFEQKKTNPQLYSLLQYYYYNYPRYLKLDALQMPEALEKSITAMESISDATIRMGTVLNRIRTSADFEGNIILVTHDALAAALVGIATQNTSITLDEGGFIELTPNHDGSDFRFQSINGVPIGQERPIDNVLSYLHQWVDESKMIIDD